MPDAIAPLMGTAPTQRLWFGLRTDFGVTLQLSRYLPYCVSPERTLVVAPELVRLFWGLGVAIAPATPADDGLPSIGVAAVPGVGLPRLWEDHGAGSEVARLPRPRVGLCWRGSGLGNQRFLPDGSEPRDVSAGLLRPLVEELSGITWIGLQLADHAHELPMHGLDAFRVRDFADTAGLLRQLDLVISVDTAVAHLAGNLGVPTWVLSPATGGPWQGLTAGAVPFYPSVRVFQQAVPGDWAPVLAEIATALDADPEELATAQRWAEREHAGGGEGKVRGWVRAARLAMQGRNISAGPWDRPS
jgi:hypothetical protein